MLDGFIHANFKRKCGFSAFRGADFENLLVGLDRKTESAESHSLTKPVFLTHC
jgi:hypothetical protein